MDFREALSVALPPPRNDEPAGLRQDILDELTDHLRSLYHRELLRGLDPAAARARATEQFGDAAALARRLWLDAMKGKIMAQRVLVATCLVVMIGSLALAGKLWLHSTQTARQMVDAELRMAQSMAEARTANEELLKQLRAMAQGNPAAQSADWIPVTFHLTLESLDGSPAVGHTVYLGRGSGGALRNGSMRRESDEKGLADFGVVQPGDWEFRVSRSGEGERSWSALGSINVLPGTKVAKPVVCPGESSDDVPVRIRPGWQTDVIDQGLQVLAQFELTGLTYQPPLRWHLRAGPGVGPDPIWEILCSHGPNAARVVDDGRLFLWRLTTDTQRRVFAQLKAGPAPAASEVVDLPAGSYRLNRLIVLRPVETEPPVKAIERYDLIAQFLRSRPTTEGTDRSAMHVLTMVAPPSNGATAPDGVWEPAQFTTFSSSYLSRVKGRFEARKGQQNEWAVPLPEELMKAVREKLKPSSGDRTK
jgi:hypothetical protein